MDSQVASDAEDAGRVREARRADFSERRHRDRLRLLEVQSRLEFDEDELSKLRSGERFPAMAPEKRSTAVEELADRVGASRSEVGRLQSAVGDLEAVVDEQGRLPVERREWMLTLFGIWRLREIAKEDERSSELERQLTTVERKSEQSTKLRSELQRSVRRRDPLRLVEIGYRFPCHGSS